MASMPVYNPYKTTTTKPTVTSDNYPGTEEASTGGGMITGGQTIGTGMGQLPTGVQGTNVTGQLKPVQGYAWKPGDKLNYDSNVNIIGKTQYGQSIVAPRTTSGGGGGGAGGPGGGSGGPSSSGGGGNDPRSPSNYQSPNRASSMSFPGGGGAAGPGGGETMTTEAQRRAARNATWNNLALNSGWSGGGGGGGSMPSFGGGGGSNLNVRNTVPPPGYQYDASGALLPISPMGKEPEYAQQGRNVGAEAVNALNMLRDQGYIPQPGAGSSFAGAFSAPGVGLGQGNVGLGAALGGGSVANIPRVSLPDQSAANAAIFARAKDQVGQSLQGALTGLRSSLGARGQLGAGRERLSTGNLFEAGLGQMGEVSRELAIQNALMGADFAKTGYQGDITQRAQDLTNQQAAAARAAQLALGEYQGQITQRGQDLESQRSSAALSLQESQARQAAIDRILAALNLGYSPKGETQGPSTYGAVSFPNPYGSF